MRARSLGHRRYWDREGQRGPTRLHSCTYDNEPFLSSPRWSLHYASLNWQEAKEWKKDGSLVVTIDTMIDGEGSSITATRTVVLGFDEFNT